MDLRFRVVPIPLAGVREDSSTPGPGPPQGTLVPSLLWRGADGVLSHNRAALSSSKPDGVRVLVALVGEGFDSGPSRFTSGPSYSVVDGCPETGNEGESLTTPCDSVVSYPNP